MTEAASALAAFAKAILPWSSSFVIRLILYIQAYMSVFAGLSSVCFYATDAAKQFRKNATTTEAPDPEAEEETDSWSQLELPMKTWLIVLACVVFFWIFLSAFLAFCCGPKFVECHLCEEPIPKRHWNKQDHWDNCNRDHERFLNELPDTDYRCPSCNEPLKCWPKGLGSKVFKCQIGQECDPQRLAKLAKMEEKGVVFSDDDHYFVDCENNGHSRFVCFADGYDACNRCAEEVLSTRSAMTASTLNKTSSAASHGSHASSKQLNGGWFDVQLKTISHQVEEKTGASTVRNGKVTTLVQDKDA